MKGLNRRKGYWMVILALTVLQACTGLRKIPEGQFLYTGAEIRFDSVVEMKNKGAVSDELYGLIEITPNTKFLWMRPLLSLHNTIKEPASEKGVKYWLKYKLGEPPSLLSDVDPQILNTTMINRLQNRGYFHAEVYHEIQYKRKKASLIFTAIPRLPYTLNEISFPSGENRLLLEINGLQSGSLIRKGAQYYLRNFQDERERIDNRLKNRGFFYFSPDYLLFEADTTVGNRRIDLELKVKPEAAGDALLPYRINNIYVSDDYALQSYDPDTTMIGNYFYISARHAFKPKVILNTVFFEKDSLYSRENHYNTLRSLMGIGVYKFTNARFTKVDSEPGLMDVSLFLTPASKISLSSEMSMAAKSNNFSGPGLNLSVKNRNLFGGAELLSITLGGRFEWQTKTEEKGQINLELTLDGSISLPRIVPFDFVKKGKSPYIDRTIITAGGGIYKRVDLYELNSFNTSLGYSWKPSERINHLFNPIDISYTLLAESSPEFDDYLEQNPNIKRSFEEQFIIGGSYTFIMSNLSERRRKTNFYLNESVDLSGNLITLLKSATDNRKPAPDDPFRLLDVAYSQFVRLRNEFGWFLKTGKESQIAWRIIVATGIPYINSSTLPYIRQFYVGGTNSVRAFPARSIGPGTYSPPEGEDNLSVDQSGDIKLESSLEYRFPIFGYLKGALFADAGNIWLVNEDEQRPGGLFQINSFYEELAAGIGIGFRFDFDFFVIRFDLATPLYKPYLPDGDRWIFQDVNFSDKSWRRENFLLNIAIGYPF